MSLAEQRLAHHTDTGALSQRGNGGAKTRPTSADDEDIVLVGLVAFTHSSLRSRMAPLDTSRT